MTEEIAQKLKVFDETLKTVTFTFPLCRYNPQLSPAINIVTDQGIQVNQLGCYDLCIEDKCGAYPIIRINESYEVFNRRLFGYLQCVAENREACQGLCPTEFNTETGEVVDSACNPIPEECSEIRRQISYGEYQLILDNHYSAYEVVVSLVPVGEKAGDNEITVELCPQPGIRPIFWSGYAPGWNNSTLMDGAEGSVEWFMARCFCFHTSNDFFYWEIKELGGALFTYKKTLDVCFADIFMVSEFHGAVYEEIIGDPAGTNTSLIIRSDEDKNFIERCCPECDNYNQILRDVSYDNPIPGESIRLIMSFDSQCFGSYFAKKNPGQTAYEVQSVPYYTLQYIHYHTPGFTGGYVIEIVEVEMPDGTFIEKALINCEDGYLYARIIDGTTYAVGQYVALAKIGCEYPHSQDMFGDYSKVQPDMGNICSVRNNNLAECLSIFINTCQQINCMTYIPKKDTEFFGDWEWGKIKQAKKDCDKYWHLECTVRSQSISTVEDCWDELQALNVSLPVDEDYAIIPYKFAGMNIAPWS